MTCSGATDQEAQFEQLVNSLKEKNNPNVAEELDMFLQKADIEKLNLDVQVLSMLLEMMFFEITKFYGGSKEVKLAEKLSNAVLDKHYSAIDWNTEVVLKKTGNKSTLFTLLVGNYSYNKEIIKQVIKLDKNLIWNAQNVREHPFEIEDPFQFLLQVEIWDISGRRCDFLKAILYSRQNNGKINFNFPVDVNFIEDLFLDKTTKDLAVQVCLSHDPMPSFCNEELKQIVDENSNIVEKLISFIWANTNDECYIPTEIFGLIKNQLINVSTLGKYLEGTTEEEREILINRILTIQCRKLQNQQEAKALPKPILNGYQGNLEKKVGDSSNNDIQQVKEHKNRLGA